MGAAVTLTSLRELIDSRSPDIAILDVNLNRELVFPIADVLLERGVPIVFLTGYPPEEIFPEHLLGLPIMKKPCDPAQLKQEVDQALGPSVSEGN